MDFSIQYTFQACQELLKMVHLFQVQEGTIIVTRLDMEMEIQSVKKSMLWKQVTSSTEQLFTLAMLQPQQDG